MNNKPLVSLICVSMNHAAYVQQGIDSFINQTYSNLEILYLDNNSSDNTFNIANGQLMKSNRQFIAHQQIESKFLSINFNYLANLAKGKYYAFISCDDWMLPNYIDNMVNQYEQQPNVGLLYSNGWYFYDDTKKIVEAQNKNFISGHIFNHILKFSALFPPGILTTSTVFKTVGGFDELNIIEDFDFWLKVAQNYTIGYSKEPLLFYRKHTQSLSNMRRYECTKYYMQTVDKYKTHPLYQQVARYYRKFYIYEHYLKGEKLEAFKKLIPDFRFEKFYFSVILKIIFR